MTKKILTLTGRGYDARFGWGQKEVEVVQVQWRAKETENFYYIDCVGRVIYRCDNDCILDRDLYSVGNYYRTKEEAEESKHYKAFHTTKEMI